MKSQSIAANGITLCYESFGEEDREVFLLISGLGAQMIRWPVSFCEALAAQDYRVIRFDNRDVGLSTHFTTSAVPDIAAIAATLARGEKPEVPYTLRDMAADAVGLLDVLGIPSAHLVGRSMGGMIAQLIAAEHPDRVLSLTSIMSSTGNPSLPPAAPDVMALLMRRAPKPSEDEEAFFAHHFAFNRRIGSPGFPFDEAKRRALIIQELGRAYNPGGFPRQLAAIAAAGDHRPLLAKITAPTLVIHGTEDPLIPSAAGEDTAASIRDARLMLIDGMGHDLPPPLHPMVIEAIVANAHREAIA